MSCPLLGLQSSEDQIVTAPSISRSSCMSAPMSRLQVRPEMFLILIVKSSGCPTWT